MAVDDLESDIDRIVRHCLDEDIGTGDITSTAIFAADVNAQKSRITMVFRARQDCVLAGLMVVDYVFTFLHADCRCEALKNDGDNAGAGDALIKITGPAIPLLAGERVALNFLQILSGIATLTRHYVEAIDCYDTKLLDTRKTLPGLRSLSKYATSIGGAINHRAGLYDKVLIKDNHIAACGSMVGAIDAVRRAGYNPIGVECDNLTQALQAIEQGADWLLLDNMDCLALRQAVERIRAQEMRSKIRGYKVVLEASGNIRLNNVTSVAQTGVDYISTSDITLAAPAVDIGCDMPCD